MNAKGAKDAKNTGNGAALGFRIKSGYAIAIVVAGPKKAPSAVARRIVDLSDPKAAETRQPYHDGFGTEHEDPREVARRIKIIERCAKKSVAELLNAAPATRASLVVGSVIDPLKVGNPHIRAHANEGKLFRTVVEDALRSHGVACDVIVEKQLAAKAATALRRSESEIKQTVAAFGKTIGGPWRADEKAAATAAWMALHDG
jgi:hypothetical protein